MDAYGSENESDSNRDEREGKVSARVAFWLTQNEEQRRSVQQIKHDRRGESENNGGDKKEWVGRE